MKSRFASIVQVRRCHSAMEFSFERKEESDPDTTSSSQTERSPNYENFETSLDSVAETERCVLLLLFVFFGLEVRHDTDAGSRQKPDQN